MGSPASGWPKGWVGPTSGMGGGAGGRAFALDDSLVAGRLALLLMDQAARAEVPVTLDDAAQADELFSILMGEDVEARRSFIQRNAKDVRFLDI